MTDPEFQPEKIRHCSIQPWFVFQIIAFLDLSLDIPSQFRNKRTKSQESGPMCTLRGKSNCLTKSSQACEDFFSSHSIANVLQSSQPLICSVACGCLLRLCPWKRGPCPHWGWLLGVLHLNHINEVQQIRQQCCCRHWFLQDGSFYRCVKRLAENNEKFNKTLLLCQVSLYLKPNKI